MSDQVVAILQCRFRDMTNNKKLSKLTYVGNLNVLAICEITGLRDSTGNDRSNRAPEQQIYG